MRPLFAGLLMLALAATAGERTIVVLDEDGRGHAGAEVTATLTPADDPRLASAVVRAGQTDAAGRLRFQADDRLILTRVQAAQDGCFSADADQRHGLGRLGQPPTLTLTLPRLTAGVPLHYREVTLTGLPSGERIGFDAEAADVVAPWGKGKRRDFELLLALGQDGWTESAAMLAEIRSSPEGRRMDEREWAEAYGRFRGTLSLVFPGPGDGGRATPAEWPYCRLKMPAVAPADGYVPRLSFVFDTLRPTEPSAALAGHFLRLRTRLGADGQPQSAHFAKIQGRIEIGPGKVTFRFYYNPRAGDRRLACDLRDNLLRPPPDATPPEQERFQAYEP